MSVLKKNFKTVTLLTSSGRGSQVVNQLFEKGYRMVDLHHARGSLVGGPVNKKGAPIESEQEIVTCVVEAHQADEVFKLIYELGEVGVPNSGFMYMQDLNGSTVQNLSAHTDKAI